MVYFGSNDGMLHAVLDTEIATDGTEVDYGTEAWAFIPPDQLNKLKEIIEGTTHQYFVDSSPKAYFKDVNKNGVIDSGEGNRIILVCGERKGGTSYFALDITDPFAPVFLWRINQYDDTAALNLPLAARPDVVIPELGESWSEPQFGLVKTSDTDTDGTPVFFIGGGYSSDNSAGKAVIAVNVFTGTVIKKFSNITGMNYSFPSSVTLVDGDSNGFVDKVYVGDLGSQMWRFGKFTDKDDNPLVFPATDENIMNWTDQAAHILFLSDPAHERKFFYPPSVTLEWGYDLVFMGTGDREDPCNAISSDRIYCVKDTHSSTTLTESDLIDVTDSTSTLPDLDVDQGWYIILAPGEKVLSEGVVFLKTYYITTFLPGEGGTLYALNYKTGEAVDGYLRVIGEGDGLLSKPVVVINKADQKLLVSASRINPAAGESGSAGPGILAIEPVAPPSNFFYMWWREL
jgi:type IV pilus assembly protein PilY1